MLSLKIIQLVAELHITAIGVILWKANLLQNAQKAEHGATQHPYANVCYFLIIDSSLYFKTEFWILFFPQNVQIHEIDLFEFNKLGKQLLEYIFCYNHYSFLLKFLIIIQVVLELKQ